MLDVIAVGDSRAVLVKKDGLCIALSDDHKVTNFIFESHISRISYAFIFVLHSQIDKMSANEYAKWAAKLFFGEFGEWKEF